MIWLWLIYRLYFLSAFCLMLKTLTSSGNFRFDSRLRRIRNTNNFDRFIKVFLHYSSHLRHIHLEDIKFGLGKCSHNLCICYLYWRDTSIQGKGAISLSPEHGHLMAQWQQLSKHELSHVNRDVLHWLVGIQHTTSQEWFNTDFHTLSSCLK